MEASPDQFIIEAETIRELQLIENSLQDVDTEITAKQYLMTRDVLAHRQNTIAKIPQFWAHVFDNASSELDTAITATDLQLLAHLQGLEVSRPEIPAQASPSDFGLDKFGEPRSILIRFHFSENKWLSDTLLEKTFWYRYGKDGSSGLVSDPVRINWKGADVDLTGGLTDASYAFWAAQKQAPTQQLDGVVHGDSRKARDAAAKEMPEYKNLANMLEFQHDGAISFFNFFSYRGRWTSAAESVEARAEHNAKRQVALAGTAEDTDDDEDDDEDFAEEDIETFPAGHEVACNIAEDIWPSAIDYFLADTIDSDGDMDGINIDDSSDEEEDDVEMS